MDELVTISLSNSTLIVMELLDKVTHFDEDFDFI